MKRSSVCILAVAASLALGTFAKPVLHVLKMSASGDDSSFANTQVVTTNSYGYAEVVDEEELKKSAPPKPAWLKETKSKQTFRITLSANAAGDTNKWFTLNIMTITKNKENRMGYGYAEPQSIRCMFLRSGAMDGSLRLIYVTPSFNSVRDKLGNVSHGWGINGVACELLDENGKVISTWTNSTYGPRFKAGLAAFIAHPPLSLKQRTIQGDSDGGFLKYKSEYILVEQNAKYAAPKPTPQ